MLDKKERLVIIIPMIICLLIITLFFLYPYLAPGEQKANKISEMCKKVQLGMELAQVETILGTPNSHTKDDDMGITTYYFDSSSVASEMTRINTRDGRVVGSYCGNGFYRWYEEVDGQKIEMVDND